MALAIESIESQIKKEGGIKNIDKLNIEVGQRFSWQDSQWNTTVEVVKLLKENTGKPYIFSRFFSLYSCSLKMEEYFI